MDNELLIIDLLRQLVSLNERIIELLDYKVKMGHATNAKLTYEEVENIRREYAESNKEHGTRTLLAKKYNVSPSTITQILKKNSWNME